MNKKTRLKFALFVVGLFCAIPAALVGVSLLAQFVTAFQEGADPASIFRGHTLVVPEAEQARWLSVESDIGEPLSRAEQDEIIAAYWLAWDAWSRAHATGDTTDLKTHWAGTAYAQVIAGIDPSRKTDLVQTGHALYLVYMSDDGSVVVVRDEAFQMERAYPGGTIMLTPSASVIMTLDQGFWRVRSLVLEVG